MSNDNDEIISLDNSEDKESDYETASDSEKDVEEQNGHLLPSAGADVAESESEDDEETESKPMEDKERVEEKEEEAKNGVLEERDISKSGLRMLHVELSPSTSEEEENKENNSMIRGDIETIQEEKEEEKEEEEEKKKEKDGHDNNDDDDNDDDDDDEDSEVEDSDDESDEKEEKDSGAKLKYVEAKKTIGEELKKGKVSSVNGNSWYAVLGMDSGEVVVCNLERDQVIARFHTHCTSIREISISDNGEFIATCAKDDGLYEHAHIKLYT
ncbi:midasin [Reticulomyxa filosa]|uniref:Midasin n=1 Tax=Reticulomyxa filosa TaxID=46433 RepID=X6NK96_RETFI|nr:midasin [Reticulomyxa filosa]|eukprot:ETO26159.1 midasin [Reticulomyxa filosa]